jgi:hypothetical protein
MPTAVRRSSSYVFFGNRFPAVVVWLAGFVLVATCVLRLEARVGAGVARWLALDTASLIAGQVWRLLPWGLVELEFGALGLIFSCLAIVMIGRDLADAWGPRRFLLTAMVLVAVTGFITALIGWLAPGLDSAHATVWPLTEGIIIAWASLFPSRQLLIYFVLPLGGRNLVLITVAGTLVFAMIHGFSVFVPHFVAEGLMLAYMREPAIKRWFRGLTASSGARRKPSHLRAVDRLEKDDEPPRWLH